MERLAVIRKDTPDLYDRMGAAVHISMGCYKSAKALAERAGRDVTKLGKGGK